MNLDPDPECWPNLDSDPDPVPDPEKKIVKAIVKAEKLWSLPLSHLFNYKKIIPAPEDILSRLGLNGELLSSILHLLSYFLPVWIHFGSGSPTLLKTVNIRFLLMI